MKNCVLVWQVDQLAIRGHPLMTSAKFLDFMALSPLSAFATDTTFPQPPLLSPLFHDALPLRCGHHIWKLPSLLQKPVFGLKNICGQNCCGAAAAGTNKIHPLWEPTSKQPSSPPSPSLRCSLLATRVRDPDPIFTWPASSSRGV